MVRDVAAVGVCGQQDALLLEEVVVRVGDLRNLRVGGSNTAVDPVVFLPEAALELKPHLCGRGVRDAANGLLKAGAKVRRDLAEHRKWNSADAVIARRFFDRPCLEVLVADAYSVVALPDLGHLGAVTDHVARLAFKCPRNLVHAAYRLEHGEGLVRPLAAERAPCLGSEQLLESVRFADDARAVTRPHVLVVATATAAGVAVLAVQRTPGAERLEKPLAILAREFLVEGPLVCRLRQQLGGVADEIGGRRHSDHRFAVVRVRAVNEGVAVVVDEHFKLNSQPLAVVEESLVAVGDAPRSGVEVFTFVEVDLLYFSAQLLKPGTPPY